MRRFVVPFFLCLTGVLSSACSKPDVQVTGEVEGYGLGDCYGVGEVFEIGSFATTARRAIVLRTQVAGCGHGRLRADEAMLTMTFRTTPDGGKPSYVTPGSYVLGEQATPQGVLNVTVEFEANGQVLAAPSSGQIELVTLDDERYAGSFSLVFDGGDKLEGDFDLSVCQR